MIFNCNKLHLSKCNGSWIFSVKRIINFKFQHPSMFVCLVSRKNDLIEVVYPFKIYQHAKFHGPTFTDASFASTSEVWTSAILEWLKLRD
jgi:hypothetical protein